MVQITETFGGRVRCVITIANEAKWLKGKLLKAVEAITKLGKGEFEASKLDIWGDISKQVKKNKIQIGT